MCDGQGTGFTDNHSFVQEFSVVVVGKGKMKISLVGVSAPDQWYN